MPNGEPELDLVPAAEEIGVRRPLNAMLLTRPGVRAGDLQDYAQRFAALLGARLIGGDTPQALSTEASKGGSAPDYPDLLICRRGGADYAQVCRTLAEVVLAGPASQEGAAAAALASAAPAAALVVSQARWPIKQILLIACGQETDLAALEWAGCIAGASHSLVTVLAVVPPAPATAAGRLGIEQGLPAMLGSDTELGAVMHRVARCLVDLDITSILRLREGPPDWQIRREVAQGDYDLVVVAAQSCRWWQQCPERDLLHLVLRGSSSPTLAVRAAPPR